MEELGLVPGRAAVVVFCWTRCPLPELPQVQVVRSTDASLARRDALVTDTGRTEPGYTLVDARGQLRYRTFDPGLAHHEQEISIPDLPTMSRRSASWSKGCDEPPGVDQRNTGCHHRGRAVHGFANYGAQFHFWLYGLFGGALGLAALAIVRILPRYGTGRASPWESGFLGHLYSALPDLLFVGFGVLHVLWTDVFAFHITLHFIPAPLYTMLAVVATAPAFAAPIPHTVQQIRDHPGLSLLCPVPTHR